MLEMAAPLHDLGKIGIPDAILNKPGRLTEDEWAVMQTHAALGYALLRNSRRPILQAGAIIAHQHHEKYDGLGYPRGLKGEEIHLYGRIGALVDVFDALASNRCYKRAWPIDAVMAYIGRERGSHFDPRLVDILTDQLDVFVAVREQYPDPPAAQSKIGSG
jgi:response regulator RpfG family c-di-GMP phosphodiesterase